MPPSKEAASFVVDHMHQTIIWSAAFNGSQKSFPSKKIRDRRVADNHACTTIFTAWNALAVLRPDASLVITIGTAKERNNSSTSRIRCLITGKALGMPNAILKSAQLLP